MSVTACDDCLRRAFLVGLLAPRIAGLLDRPGEDRSVPRLFSLSDRQLIAAVAGRRAEEAERFAANFDAGAARRRVGEAGIGACCNHAERYPPQLRELEDPPAVLFHTGPGERLTRALREPAVAIVGSRRGSAYGLEVARALGRGLAAAGVTVVSGLALGVDAAAHRGSLVAGGTAVAVLAGGADVPYPRRHRRLYEDIRRSGVVLSELPPGQRPFRWSFPARNRIMAGLARLTVVVEAAEASGSLITADFAQQLGRGVAAVPGRVTSRVASGTNRLLRDGARVVTASEDVLDELFGVADRRSSDGEGGRLFAPHRAEPSTPELRRVLEAVEGGGGVGEISGQTGLAAGEVRAALARLERDGLVVRDGLASWERAMS